MKPSLLRRFSRSQTAARDQSKNGSGGMITSEVPPEVMNAGIFDLEEAKKTAATEKQGKSLDEVMRGLRSSEKPG